MYHIFCIIEESKRSTKCPQCRRDFKKITRLAKGVPVGGEIEFLDDGTLFSAFKNRAPLIND